MSGSLTRGGGRGWRGKRSRHSRRMRNHQFYVVVKMSVIVSIGTAIWFLTQFIQFIREDKQCFFPIDKNRIPQKLSGASPIDSEIFPLLDGLMELHAL